MALDERTKKVWQDIPAKHTVPVNVIGVPIQTNDKNTLAVWKDEGIDQHLKK
jgi:hypothetical protein